MLPEEESVNGWFLLATHMILDWDLYQIPMYRFAVLFCGLKNPNVKKPPLEVTVSGSLMYCDDMIVSLALPNSKQEQKNMSRAANKSGCLLKNAIVEMKVFEMHYQ